ncbi:MAG: hypothetical protein LC775_01595, partial [Acidobacteria bacterium]|nr:hypothetical protein [Acidobacteriota bacterium]
LEARAALYRSLLDGRRMLIVLDNANTAEQVRPLLPGSPTCRVVVTSRNRLSGLIARDGASRVTVDLLAPAEAIALLGDVIGVTRAAAEPEATAELASRCAYLPLALRIAAERVGTHVHTTLADLAGELAMERNHLDFLTTADEEDEATVMRSVFSWSYRALSPEAARAFRLLGLHAGPDISAPAVAALTNTTPSQARRLLETLVGTHLIAETGRDRYRFHDLLRVYAADCAKADETNRTVTLPCAGCSPGICTPATQPTISLTRTAIASPWTARRPVHRWSSPPMAKPSTGVRPNERISWRPPAKPPRPASMASPVSFPLPSGVSSTCANTGPT